MTHPRQTIRDNAVSLLTGLATTGANVFPSRVYPVEYGKLPALAVYMGAEQPADSDLQSMGYTREIEAELMVDVIAAASTGLDDQLDAILSEIQAAIAADRTLSGALTRTAEYGGVDAPEFSDQAETEHATMTVTYTVTYEVTL